MRLPILFLFIITTMFLLPSDLSGQYILKKGKKYILNENIYTRENLGEVFIKLPEAMDYYNRGIGKKQKANLYMTFGGIMSGVGSLFLYSISHGNDSARIGSPDYGKVLRTLLSGGLTMGGVMFLINGMTLHGASKLDIRRAINVYNANDKSISNNEVGYLSLGVTNHGVSLVYSF